MRPAAAKAARFYLPASLAVFLLTLTIAAWRLEIAHERDHINAQGVAVARSWTRQISETMNDELWPLRWIVRDWGQRNDRTADVFLADAKLLLHHDSLCAGLAWVDDKGALTIVAPASDGGQPFADFANNVAWAQAIARSRETRDGSIARVSTDGPRDDTNVGCVVPDYLPDGRYAGAIIGEVRLGRAMKQIFTPTREDFHLELCSDVPGHVLVHSGDAPDQDVALRVNEPFTALGHTWTLRMRPTPRFVQRWSSSAALLILLSGIVISLTIPAVVYQSLKSRASEAEQARQHADALESLNTILSSVAANLGSGRDLLDQLAETARRLIGTDMAAFALLDEERQTVTFTGTSGLPENLAHGIFSLDEAPMTRKALEHNDIVVLEDVRAPLVPINVKVMNEYSARAMMVIPLRVSNRSIGAMLVAEKHPRVFSPSDRRLAAVWGAQASAIMGNHHLYLGMDAALRAEKKLVGQLETLYAISTEMYRAGTLEASLQRLADQAPAALGVDQCSISMLTPKADEFTVVALTGGDSPLLGRTFAVAGTNVERLMKTRKPIIIEDCPNDCITISALRDAFQIGSVIHFPLTGSEGQMVGVLAIIRHAKGKFSDDQITMGSILAARAAVTIDTARLHETERRQADTQVILLRELNHRVKNNLASIVALLSMGTPEMTADARQWLDRVTERVTTMARAHELFTGGVKRVGLDALVGPLLHTFSKPPGVTIVNHTGGVGVRLDSDRAVSLAMVLHELCFNALQHGLRGVEGTLEVTATTLHDGRRLRIDVIDDGAPQLAGVAAISGAAQEAHTTEESSSTEFHPSTGIGLQLVRGLVSRELRGKFSLRTGEGGGTVATLEFPLLPQEVAEGAS